MVLAMVQKKNWQNKTKNVLRCLCFRVFDAVFFLHFLVHFQNTRIDRTLLIQFDELPLEKLDLAIFYFVKKNAPLKIKFLQRIHVVISRIPNFRRSNNLNATLLPAVFNISKWCPRKKGDASSSQHFVRSCSILAICCKSWTCWSLAKKALKQ